MRISVWSSGVCSSYLLAGLRPAPTLLFLLVLSSACPPAARPPHRAGGWPAVHRPVFPPRRLGGVVAPGGHQPGRCADRAALFLPPVRGADMRVSSAA